eukprot:TRINITY_DN2995_c0_g2_i1.p1 TRINITY_DN2995_c0_g2~~TRINITY_DN2995_c0_g2_i1.p1  ORF type:complete len:268 (-),score=74.72 TRINITY_DN2995_c0_g2_i1:626-1429(-)
MASAQSIMFVYSQAELMKKLDAEGYEYKVDDGPLGMKEQWLTKLFAVMDEHFDAPLTALGRAQADEKAEESAKLPPVELVICSSLSRAMETAARVFPRQPRPLLVLDEVREFAGPTKSEQRRPKSALPQHVSETLRIAADTFDFSSLRSEEDPLWQPKEEQGRQARERADKALQFLLDRPEQTIAVVAHTSFMRQLLLGRRNSAIKLVPDNASVRSQLHRDFDNCEIRSVYLWRAEDAAGDPSGQKSAAKFCMQPADTQNVIAASKL